MRSYIVSESQTAVPTFEGHTITDEVVQETRTASHTKRSARSLFSCYYSPKSFERRYGVPM